MNDIEAKKYFLLKLKNEPKKLPNKTTKNSGGSSVKSEALTSAGLFCRYTVCSFIYIVKYISIQ